MIRASTWDLKLLECLLRTWSAGCVLPTGHRAATADGVGAMLFALQLAAFCTHEVP